MALSGGDLTNARADGHRTLAYLSIIPQTSVATARVNQSSFNSQLPQLTVDTWTDRANVQFGMTVWIGTSAGARDIGVFRIRKVPTTTILYIGEISKGDFGTITNTQLAYPSDNAYVTVMNDYNLHSIPPRIASDIIYKDYDITYGTFTSTAPPCPLNIGAHIAEFVGGGSTITVSKTATIDGFVSDTISSVTWDIDDGSFTVGNANSTSFTATFPAGFRWITCTVTLSTGTVLYSYRAVWAHDTSSNAPTSINITGDTRNRTGRSITCQLPDDVAATDVPNGAMCIVWEDSSWGDGNDITSGITQTVGWVPIRGTAQTPGITSNSITVMSGYQAMQDMVAYSQQLTVDATPANWAEVIQALSHSEFFVYYLLHWGTTLSRLFDVSLNSDLESTLFSAWLAAAGTIPEQMASIYKSLSAWMGQASDGTLHVAREYNMLDSADRAAITAIMELNGGDVSQISVEPRFRPAAGRVEATAFSYNSGTGEATPLISHSPGSLGGQGSQTVQLDGLLVTNQAELNKLSANKYAQENNPYRRVTINIPRNYDFFEPARGDVLDFDFSGVSDWPETDLSTGTAQVLEVNKVYDGTGNASITLVVEVESHGYNAPGETIPVPVSDDIPTLGDGDEVWFPGFDGWDPGSWPPWGGIDFIASPPVSGDATYRLVVWADQGIGLSEYRTGPSFVELTTPQASHVYEDVLIDEDSAYPGTYAGALALYALEYDSGAGSTDAIYEDDSLDAGATFPTKQTLTGQWTLIRPVRGVSGGVAVFGSAAGTPTTLTGIDNNTDPLIFFGSIYDLYASFANSSNGIYSAAGGRTTAPRCLGQSTGVDSGGLKDENACFIDLKTSATITQINYYHDAAGAGGKLVGRVVKIFDHTFTDVPVLTNYNNADSGSGYLAENWSGSQVGYRVICISNHSNTADSLTLGVDDLDIDYTPTIGQFHYSSDNLTTVGTLREFGQGFGVPVGDIDDHNSGDTLAAYGDELNYSATYGAAFAVATGALLDNSAAYACLRIPYLKFSDKSNNSSSAALEFIFAADRLLSDDTTLWTGTINTATGVVTTGSDITPIIDGTTYVVYPGPHSLEVWGNDPDYIRAIARDESDTAPFAWYIIETIDGGTTWTLQAAMDGQYIWHVGTSSLWLFGTDGIDYSNDGGTTLNSRDGNFEAAVDDFPALGGRPL